MPHSSSLLSPVTLVHRTGKEIVGSSQNQLYFIIWLCTRTEGEKEARSGQVHTGLCSPTHFTALHEQFGVERTRIKGVDNYTLRDFHIVILFCYC
jgi:hypothetical protein